MRIGNFEVLSKYIVEPDLEGRYAGPFGFFLLQLHQVLLTAGSDLAQAVQLFVYPGANGIAFGGRYRGIVDDRRKDLFDNRMTGIQAGGALPEIVIGPGFT